MFFFDTTATLVILSAFIFEPSIIPILLFIRVVLTTSGWVSSGETGRPTWPGALPASSRVTQVTRVLPPSVHWLITGDRWHTNNAVQVCLLSPRQTMSDASGLLCRRINIEHSLISEQVVRVSLLILCEKTAIIGWKYYNYFCQITNYTDVWLFVV